MSSVLSVRDFKSAENLIYFLDGAKTMVERAKKRGYPPPTRGKALIQMKEASSRTGGSFEEAAAKIGLRTREIQGKDHTSLRKGESPYDDIITHANQEMDVYVTRTKVEGESRYLAEILQENGHKVPVINGGDGEHDHVTQMLLDWYTIRQKMGRIDNFTIGFCGDLTFGRTVHSNVQAVKLLTNVKVVLCSFGGLKLPEHLKKDLNIVDEVDGDLSPLCKCDVIYATRIQKERIILPIDFSLIEKSYVINRDFLDRCKKNVLLMHPQPVVFEIGADIRNDSRLIMDEQAWNGLPMRMFILDNAIKNYQPLDLEIASEDLEEDKRTIRAEEAKKRGKYFNPVEKGTVIDHLKAGSAHYIETLLGQLGVDISQPILTAKNMPSDTCSSGEKDVILLHDQCIKGKAAGVLRLISPGVTINILEGDGLMHKLKFRPPHNIKGVFKCPNPMCITNIDRYAKSWFEIQDGDILCHYDERTFNISNLRS